jgi:hypothetical protein
LIDVLQRLQFISREVIVKNGVQLRAMLKHENLNLLIGQDGGPVVDPELSVIDEASGKEIPYLVPTEDVAKNLFKVCCAVVNFRPKQRMVNKLDDIILQEHLEPLAELTKGTTGNPDAYLVEQLHIIKSLVQRRAFSLTEKQTQLINGRFTNFSFSRKLKLHTRHKERKIRQHRDETTPEFSPEINAKSRRLDQYVTHSRREPGMAKVYG